MIAALQIISNQKNYFFTESHDKILVSVYGENPFPESKVLGDFVAERRQPGDKLLILGSEPELLVYSKLQSASRHIYTYSLMNGDSTSKKFQDEMLNDLNNKPRFVVFTNIPGSWLFNNTPENLKFWNKMNQVLNQSKIYKRIATADLFTDGTDYHFDTQASNINFERSKINMDVYELIK